MFSWRRPEDLGVKEGRLAPCKTTPNCVSSQANPYDAEHYIEPLHGTLRDVRRAVDAMPRTKIIAQTETYLYAEFRSALLGYVDDVEFLADGSVIHVRSASRLGRRDFGVNRKRIETIRRLMQAPR